MHLLLGDLKSILNSSQQHCDSDFCCEVMAMMILFPIILHVFVGPLNLSTMSSPSIFLPSPVFSNCDNTV